MVWYLGLVLAFYQYQSLNPLISFLLNLLLDEFVAWLEEFLFLMVYQCWDGLFVCLVAQILYLSLKECEGLILEFYLVFLSFFLNRLSLIYVFLSKNAAFWYFLEYLLKHQGLVLRILLMAGFHELGWLFLLKNLDL